MPSPLNLGVAVGLSALGSISLITCIDFVSNMVRLGWLVAKPCPVFASTTAPLPPPFMISPSGLSVSASKTVTRPGTASLAGGLSLAGHQPHAVPGDLDPGFHRVHIILVGPPPPSHTGAE